MLLAGDPLEGYPRLPSASPLPELGSMTYEVKLEVFEGPFDLLLQLISRRKVDVAEVDLAEITSDFLASLQGIEELDLETATRFLVVAATLVELKAARLLPTEDQEELEDALGEARDLLYARLLEYRAFRDAAELIRRHLHANEGYVPREGGLEPRFRRLVPDTDLPVGIEDLATMAALATAPKPEPRVDLGHIRKSYISVRDAADEVLARLRRADRAATFGELVADRGKGDRVVFFLAVLELYKLGHLGLEQPDHHGPIHIERREGGRDLGSILDDEYDAAEPDETDDDGDVDGSAGGELVTVDGGRS